MTLKEEAVATQNLLVALDEVAMELGADTQPIRTRVVYMSIISGAWYLIDEDAYETT